MDRFERFGFRAAELLPAVHRRERDLLVLEAAFRRAARAADGPTGAVTAEVAALEIDFRPPRARTTPQERAHVLGAERGWIIVTAADDDRAAVCEARRAIEERDAHR